MFFSESLADEVLLSVAFTSFKYKYAKFVYTHDINFSNFFLFFENCFLKSSKLSFLLLRPVSENYFYFGDSVTKTDQRLLIGKCVDCNRKKSLLMITQQQLKVTVIFIQTRIGICRSFYRHIAEIEFCNDEYKKMCRAASKDEEGFF